MVCFFFLGIPDGSWGLLLAMQCQGLNLRFHQAKFQSFELPTSHEGFLLEIKNVILILGLYSPCYPADLPCYGELGMREDDEGKHKVTA